MNGNDRIVSLWLFVICALVFLIVIVGGATRLTDSGLSITEWKPIMGAIPPLSAADWAIAFEKYKAIPEYTQVNQGMTLEGFKTIFWWEWAHRFLGRFIGVVFLIPFLFFWARGMIHHNFVPGIFGLFILGGMQGVLGWYMVKSGLVDRVDVSQYRLAAHLGLAILIFGFGLWWGLGLRNSAREDGSLMISGLRLSAFGLMTLIFLQIISGGFVAGMDAGLSHNTWPLMEGKLIPDGLGVMSPWYTNLFENALTVQFDHRMIAYAILAWVVVHLFALRQSTELIDVPTGAKFLASFIGLQILLGIATLLTHVPIALALGHQALAVITFGIAVYHLRRLSDLSAA